MAFEIANTEEIIQSKWMSLFIALVMSFLVLIIAWTRNFFKQFGTAQFVKIRGWNVIVGFGLFLLFQILMVPLFISLVSKALWGAAADQELNVPLVRNWINFFLIIGGCTGSALAFFTLNRSQRQFLVGKQKYADFLLGVASWFLIYPLMLFLSQGISLLVWYIFHQTFEEQVVVQNLRKIMEHPILFGLTGLSIITIVPLSEEFLFRGLLQNWLKDKLGSSFAITLTSIVFAFFHFSTDIGISNIELISSLYVLSWMLGYLFERQQSLWASVGLHSIFNLISLLMIIYVPKN